MVEKGCDVNAHDESSSRRAPGPGCPQIFIVPRRGSAGTSRSETALWPARRRGSISDRLTGLEALSDWS